jgi:thiol-disulfide isomerase/thioredoxin
MKSPAVCVRAAGLLYFFVIQQAQKKQYKFRTSALLLDQKTISEVKIMPITDIGDNSAGILDTPGKTVLVEFYNNRCPACRATRGIVPGSVVLPPTLRPDPCVTFSGHHTGRLLPRPRLRVNPRCQAIAYEDEDYSI